MDNFNFRPLNANEIECRVGSVTKDGSSFTLLLYKNARVDQIILDETFGAWNWQCKYYQVKNTMVCSVGVNANFDHPECEPYWIWKDNGGDDQTEMEQIKAELSDSFKRACFNWGIGRELYYSPRIWIKVNDDNTKFARYSVKNIEYGENKRITRLTIINDKTKEVVFLYGEKEKVAKKGDLTPKTPIADNEQRGSIDKNDLIAIQTIIDSITNETKRQNFYTWLNDKYGTMNPEFLTLSQGKQVLTALGGKK